VDVALQRLVFRAASIGNTRRERGPGQQ
jgi:hypothetical protein